jgi:hypothetical protein
MSPARQGRLALVTAALITPGLLGASASTDARPPPPPSRLVSFRVATLFPSFSPHIHDYVVRCNDAPVRVAGRALGSWRAAIGNHPFRRGYLSRVVGLSAGRAVTITTKRRKRGHLYRYHVRCLPNDFPTYSFTRYGPISPKYFSVDQFRAWRYAIIFNNHGVPIWWDRGLAHGTTVLSDGNVLWANHRRDPAKWEIHRLDGRLVRTLNPIGHPANHHDLQVLGNGDYLVGSNVKQSHVDTSAYGGSSDADVANAELQQVSPDGQLVWDWKSQDHISLSETTGFRWRWIIDHPAPQGYDISHWNSIEPAGNSVIASFRHLDAVYKIRKSTGDIVWKLGGTSTPRSLDVEQDPRGNTFGAQHDARLLSGGTVTVFDNRTNLPNKRPRAVRFRIDRTTGTATLLQSITDPDVPVSSCCGSARRLDNGHWLIAWGKDQTGKTGPIGGYTANGQRTFRLTFGLGFSYRAEPVPAGVVSAEDLREGMRAMANPG